MKKILYAIGISAAVVACSVDENKLEQPLAVKGGVKLRLSGEAFMGTKVSIGEKDGATYPLLWGTGDVISISSKDTSATGAIVDERAELFGETAGKANGVFQTYNEIVTDKADEIVIVYPGSSVTYGSSKIKGTIPEYQEQRSSNSSVHVGNYALAYAEASLAAGQKEDVKFTLNQKTAFVKLVLTTSEYSSMNLKGVKITAPDNVLSGKATYDIDTKELTVKNGTDGVGVNFRNPVQFNGTQEMYFTAIPCDLTGKDVYVSVFMTDGTKNVTIPAKIAGGKLSEACLSIITINVSSSLITSSWYEPVEVRDLVDGWAYGPQNTYFIEQKAKGEGETHIVIDVKARGDFSKVKEPKYYGLYTGSSEMFNNTNNSGRRLIHLPNNVIAYEEHPVNTVNPDYTIDVYAYDQAQNGRWAVVAIYDEDYKVLWTYMIQKYVAGDEPKSVDYPGFALLDRNLGATYGNAKAEELKTIDNAGAFFQWGRKDPFMWSNSGQPNYNQKLVTADIDIATVISTPGMIYGYVNANGVDSKGDWQAKEHRTDLWGGVNNTANWFDPDGTGHKTIYDPCPEGYRVPDAKVFQELAASAEIWEANINNAYQPAENIKADSPFAAAKFSVLAYPLGNGKYDYWPYAGAHWGSNGSFGNRTSSNTQHGCLYWANSIDPTNANAAAMLEYCYFSTSYNANTRHTSSRAQCFAVRCQKE